MRGPAAWCSTRPRSAKALPVLACRACRSWRPSVTRNDRRKYILPLIINSSMKISVYPFSKHPFMQSDFAAHRPVIKWMTLDPGPWWIYTPFSDITGFIRDKGQVMVGNLRIARACSVNRFAFLLWLYDDYEEEKKVKDRFFFSNFNKPIFNNY